MNPYEIAPYLGDELIINGESLGFKLNKNWRRVAFKNKQGNVIGYGRLPAGLRVLAESREAKNFKLDDEIVYDPQGFIQRSDLVSFSDNETSPLVEREDVFKIASCTITYDLLDIQEKYNKGKLSIKFSDGESQQNTYILPAVIEKTNNLQTSDNYILKLDRDFRGQKYIYYSEYTDTWLKIIKLESNDIVDLKLKINLGKEGSGIHVDPYFGLTWTEVVKRLLRCRAGKSARTPHVANLKVNNANSFSFGGQYENQTSEDIAVYGPAPRSNQKFQQDFSLYRLSPSQTTPESLSFYGVYIPKNRSKVSGPAAALIPSKNFVIKQDDSNRYILPNNAEIIKPGEILNLEVPDYSQSDISNLPFPNPQTIQQKPARSSKLTRDTNQLRIVTPSNISVINNYFEFIQNFQVVTFESNLSPTSSNKWYLVSPTGKVVHKVFNSFAFSITSEFLREQVEKLVFFRLQEFGIWKLKLEFDQYFDFVNFEVSQSQQGQPKPVIKSATTTKSFYNIRKVPGNLREYTTIGELNGKLIPAELIDKAKVDDIIWYKIIPQNIIPQKSDKYKDINPGTHIWINDDGVSSVIPWELFLRQLNQFENNNSSLSITQRITKLRQICHPQNLPFDTIIGVPKGDIYQDTKIFVRSEWQILESVIQKVVVPDGSIVDIYHLLVGLDVLLNNRPRENFEITLGDASGFKFLNNIPDGKLPTFDIGSNYAAATWSGDIGAGAMDALIGVDTTWEKKNDIPEADRNNIDNLKILNDYYYTSRAPESDLLGDIDAWGINKLRSNSSYESIEKLLRSYYENIDINRMITISRKTSIELFLSNYEFNTSKPLISQHRSRNKISNEIKKFANIWYYRVTSSRYIERAKKLDIFVIPQLITFALSIIARYEDEVQEENLISWHVDPMTNLFLNWLDDLASKYGVSIEE